MILSQLPEIHRYRLAEGRLRRNFNARLPWRLEEVLNSPGRHLTLTYSSPLLLPGGASQNDSFVNVGPTIGASADWGDFPAEKLTSRPLIYASLGTLTNRNSRFYENCLKAFAGDDYQLVLSLGTKNGSELFSRERPGVIVREFVPQLKVLQQAAVFISHAGMNSAHESLYYGVPLVMAPQQVEQQVVASQVVQAGAGICLSATPSAENLRAAVAQVLNDPAYVANAAQVRDSLRDTGGAGRAAEAIERLIERESLAASASVRRIANSRSRAVNSP
ncbi:MAG: glycosyltransferase [Planctomycetaceae bacterium]